MDEWRTNLPIQQFRVYELRSFRNQHIHDGDSIIRKSDLEMKF